MKNLMLILSVVSLLASHRVTSQSNSGKPNIANDLVTENVKGKVQSYTMTFSNLDSTGTSEQPIRVTMVNYFDENGFQSKSFMKMRTRPTPSEMSYSRYPNGAIKERKTERDGKVTSRTEYELDKNGKYTAGKIYDSTNTLKQYLKDIVTNEYGLMTSYKTYNTYDKLVSSSEEKYEKTHTTESITRDSTGKIIGNFAIKLNEKGDETGMTMGYIEKDSTITDRITFRYDAFDDKGNWTKRTFINEKGQPIQVARRTFTYYKD